MTGEVVYLFAFDVGSEIVPMRVGPLFGQRPVPLDIRQDHTSPRDVPLTRPLAVDPGPLFTAAGHPVRVQVRVYEVGVVSVLLRLPVQAERLEDLTPFHRLTLDDGRPVAAAAQEVCGRVVGELGPALERPTPASDPEAYTVFALTDLGGPQDVPGWLTAHEAEAAGLLSDVPAGRLAPGQVAEVMRHRQSFQTTDVVVVDWDAALVVDLTGYREDVLFVLELANIQLEEFRVLDRALDRHLSAAYGLAERRTGFRLGRTATGLRQLRSMSVDLAKLADEVTHITKFLGDWYLARVYLRARERFHLEPWRASVTQRLGQLNELYTVVRAEVGERRMLWLEVAIVIFFAIDLFALFVLKH